MRSDRRPPLPEYPLIEGYEPEWAVGQAKPVFYRHTETGKLLDTPDYDQWHGDWAALRNA